MNKELKLLLVSVGLLVAGVTFMYLFQHQKCTVEEYQNLSGHHVVEKCEIVP
jgi:hypothetical protein